MIIAIETKKGTFKIYAIEGQANTERQVPENLDVITQDGDGVYHNTEPVWGKSILDATKKISVETATGGLIFFDDSGYSYERFIEMMRILDIAPPKDGMPVEEHRKDFALFVRSSKDPGKDGYITQWRFVSSFGMQFYYRREEEAKKLEENPQSLGMIDTMVLFIEKEMAKYGGLWNKDLNKLIGATGDECGHFGLGFGFLVENHYHHIYRLWSRPVFYSK